MMELKEKACEYGKYFVCSSALVGEKILNCSMNSFNPHEIRKARMQ
jgi:hypothetical protein